MAGPELIHSMSVLSKRIDNLLSQITNLQLRVYKLETENAELRKQHLEEVSKLENARKEIEFLSVSHRLADSPEALISARQKVAKLIRTIDNCIRMINED